MTFTGAPGGNSDANCRWKLRLIKVYRPGVAGPNRLFHQNRIDTVLNFQMLVQMELRDSEKLILMMLAETLAELVNSTF